MSSIEERKKIGQQILNWEARRDAKGRLAVYKLPPADGGGTYEVGGINDKYHPQKAQELKNLVEAGKYAEAERSAIDYIATYTDGAANWTSVTAIEAFLRDCYFNRGPGGAARIFQIALRVGVDGDVGDKTMKAAQKAEREPHKLLQDLRAARENYERNYVHRDESSIFWKGLVNRWNYALEFSLDFLQDKSFLLTKVASDIKIYSTSEWGARPPRRTDFLQSPVQGIVVHNTEHENRAPLSGEVEKAKAFQIARDIQIVHLKRRDKNGVFWSDTGQNFTISRGGIIMEGRHGSLAVAKTGKVVRGAHANSNEHNKSWFGIELEGYYVKKYAMTDEQWKSLVELCAWLSIWGHFDTTNLKGHKEVSSTDCPGLLMEHLAKLKSEAERRKKEILGANN
jgi:hypothetical protein